MNGDQQQPLLRYVRGELIGAISNSRRVHITRMRLGGILDMLVCISM